MMDIVKRLRAFITPLQQDMPELSEAANEIERLRDELRDVERFGTHDEMEKEIKRLRAALKPFAAAHHSDNPAEAISLHDLRVAAETLEAGD